MKMLTFIGLIAGLFFMAQVQAQPAFRDYQARPVWREFRPHDWVDARQHRQQRRIEQGIYSGRLSPSEVKKLQRHQKKIARLEHRFKRDGWLSQREQLILDRKLDRVSDQIDHLKHNERLGRPGYRPYQNRNRGKYYSSYFDSAGQW